LGASFVVIEPPPEAPKSHKLSVVGNALLSNWSDYRDRHNQTPSGDYAWSRTVSPTLGVRYTYAGWGTFLDATYVPSPVPLQTGRSNYVDNNRLGLGAGVVRAFTLLGAAFRAGLHLQAHHLLSRSQQKLDPTNPANKNKDPASLVIDEVPDDAIDNANSGRPAAGRQGLQTNNPGWPGFASEGWILAGGANLALLF
jgi:hypothetical protein